MLYTIGKIDVYERYMANDQNAAKGVTGSVFLTFEQAKAYRNAHARHFGLYGVLADWDANTKDVGHAFRALTEPGKLVKIDEKTGKTVD